MESEKFILWKQRLEEIKQSDLTVDEWCKQNQISKHAYYYWRKKILDSMNNVNKTTCFAEVIHFIIKMKRHSLLSLLRSWGMDVKEFCRSC